MARQYTIEHPNGTVTTVKKNRSWFWTVMACLFAYGLLVYAVGQTWAIVTVVVLAALALRGHLAIRHEAAEARKKVK